MDMQWAEILSALILVVLGWMQAGQITYRKRTEKRAQTRAEEACLQMEAQAAVCKLAMLTAKKVAGGHVNGELEDAAEEAKEVQDKYSKYITGLAAEQATKV